MHRQKFAGVFSGASLVATVDVMSAVASAARAVIIVAALILAGYFCMMVAQNVLWSLSLAPTTYNRRDWTLVNSYRNVADAAKLLGDTHWKMIHFMDRLRKKYHIDETDDTISAEGSAHVTSEGSSYVNALLDNYNPDHIYENDPARSADTSYTVGKGARTYFCLRNRADPTRLIDPNTFMFVMLHECAHIANYATVGHDPQFWTVFKFILSEAVEAGVITPVDYARNPVDYCGLKINYQPLNDPHLRVIR